MEWGRHNVRHSIQTLSATFTGTGEASKNNDGLLSIFLFTDLLQIYNLLLSLQ
jgi:hypothetical protein